MPFDENFGDHGGGGSGDENHNFHLMEEAIERTLKALLSTLITDFNQCQYCTMWMVVHKALLIALVNSPNEQKAEDDMKFVSRSAMKEAQKLWPD
jgi:hypothetical protein